MNCLHVIDGISVCGMFLHPFQKPQWTFMVDKTPAIPQVVTRRDFIIDPYPNN